MHLDCLTLASVGIPHTFILHTSLCDSSFSKKNFVLLLSFFTLAIFARSIVYTKSCINLFQSFLKPSLAPSLILSLSCSLHIHMRARRQHTYDNQPSTFYHASTRSLVYFDFSLTHDTCKRWSTPTTAIPALIYLHVANFYLCLTTISRFFYSFLPRTYITVQHKFSVFVLLALVILLILRLARASVYVFTRSLVHSPDPTIRIGSPYSVEEKDFYHSMNTCSFGFPTARFSLHANS